jgi:orotate phosphoribosyltransferase
MNRGELAARVAQRCWLRGQFHLRSGQTSNTYFDKYRFESDPVLLSGIAQHLLPLGIAQRHDRFDLIPLGP